MFIIGAIYADSALRTKNANRLLSLLSKKTTDLLVPTTAKSGLNRLHLGVAVILVACMTIR